VCTVVFCARFIVRDVTEHGLLHSYLAMQGDASARLAIDFPYHAIALLDCVDLLSFV